ncbi:small secreted protein [Streptomyces marincola]|uniref:small secreted protein n=1 Tax=Streptomyces marincola TaxID=2878388 RepID=UPI002100279C|nr:small secreted protein [Streptomyces marincola]
MNKKLAVTLSGGAALLLTLTACGGGDGTEEADRWAASVCDGLQPQVERIQSAYSAIAEVSEGNRSPEEVQEADSQAYGEISAAYSEIAGVVEEAGEPPVDDGERVRDDAVAALNDLSSSFGELKEQVDALDTSDQAAFAEGLGEIVPRLEELGQSGNDALNELEAGELGEALGRQEGCRAASPVPDDDGAGGDAEGESGEAPEEEQGEQEEEQGEAGGAGDEGQ